MKLDDVVPWGRSFDEYVAMFDLSANDLSGRILDCGAGPASFAAEAAARGYKVTACDPIYQFSAAEIERRVEEIAPTMVAQMQAEQQGYRWDRLGSPAAVGVLRRAAMQRFVDDFPVGRSAGRYVEAALPNLPFPDAAFDLALASHFLFLYATQLSSAFHAAAVAELLRVAGEVRIFPLIDLEGRRSVHVAPVVAALSAQGYRAEIVPVRYEFRRGANEMLLITRPES